METAQRGGLCKKDLGATFSSHSCSPLQDLKAGSLRPIRNEPPRLSFSSLSDPVPLQIPPSVTTRTLHVHCALAMATAPQMDRPPSPHDERCTP